MTNRTRGILTIIIVTCVFACGWFAREGLANARVQLAENEAKDFRSKWERSMSQCAEEKAEAVKLASVERTDKEKQYTCEKLRFSEYAADLCAGKYSPEKFREILISSCNTEETIGLAHIKERACKIK